MSRISAANNLIIEMQPNRWRLLVNGDSEERVLLEAMPGQPLHYVSSFAVTRHLPEHGLLPSDQIRRVVLGWSHEDAAWHLGFLLGPELAQIRGSRWCEVAHWPDENAAVFGNVATQAGETLAQALARPFNIIEPRVGDQASPPALPDLPLDFGTWIFERNKYNQFQFARSSSWAKNLGLRALWYTILAVIYVILVGTSLTSGIALPRPELVLYLGAASALLLVGVVFYMVYQILTKPDKISFDPLNRNVRALRGDQERWSLRSGEIQAVYVTHVVDKRGKKQKGRTVHYSELNLHLSNDQFCHIFDQEHLAEKTKHHQNADPYEIGDDLIPLTPDMVFTDLQAASLYIAQALGVPCWYDRRFR